MTTPLDAAHAAMEAAPDDETARLRFYERLADAELYLMLTQEPDEDRLDPELFDVDDARFVLAFDREDRLSQFAGRAVPYAALSGRALAGMAAGAGIGLALNPDVAPSAILLPPDALAWLRETLDHAPQEAQARPVAFAAPEGLPEALLSALDTKLAAAPGLARAAHLAQVTYEDGSRGHILAFTGTAPGAEAALAGAMNEALVFSGLEAGALDVTFLPDDARAAELVAGVSLRFDLPQPELPTPMKPVAPGSDPDKPPRLR